ncbi:hypothetical protein ABBQ32_013281 [Trebouxia sp. C0010 RCD-2024]
MFLLPKKYSRDALSGDTVSDVTSNQFVNDSAQSDPAQSRSHVSAGVVGLDRSTSSAPDPTRLQIVNFALGELGSADIKSKSDVAKMKAADIKLLAEYLQQHLDHDPQDAGTEPPSFQLAPCQQTWDSKSQVGAFSDARLLRGPESLGRDTLAH